VCSFSLKKKMVFDLLVQALAVMVFLNLFANQRAPRISCSTVTV
jgi:hypothetical protein